MTHGWRVATVRQVRAEGARARTLTLDVPGWPGHRAGQHVDVRLTAEDGYRAQRAYSIASAPESPLLELTVERLADGEVSSYLTNDLAPGDPLELRGPIGGWFTWAVAEGGPLLLVAGGTGLVPLVAMIRHRRAQGSIVPVRLLVSVRSRDVLLYREELESPSDPALEIVLTYTRDPPPGWRGLTGRVDADLLRRTAFPVDSGQRVFVCGSTPFVETVAGALASAGLPFSSIRTERFGPTGGA